MNPEQKLENIIAGFKSHFEERIKTKIGRMIFREEAAAMRRTTPQEEKIGGFENEEYEPSEDLIKSEFLRKLAMEYK